MSPALDYSQMADLYDHLVDWTGDLEFFRQEAVATSGFVLELMSGTGRVSVPLVEAGVELTCVDSSAEMLDRLRAKLRARGLNAAVFEQDVLDLSLPESYALVLIPFHSFEELTSPSDQRRALASIRSVLVHGGQLICTLHNPEIRRFQIAQGPMVIEGSSETAEVRAELDVKYDPETGQVHGSQQLIVKRAADQHEIRRRLAIKHALIGKSEFSEMATATGYEIEELFGDYDRSPFSPADSPHMIWVLRKP